MPETPPDSFVQLMHDRHPYSCHMHHYSHTSSLNLGKHICHVWFLFGSIAKCSSQNLAPLCEHT